MSSCTGGNDILDLLTSSPLLRKGGPEEVGGGFPGTLKVDQSVRGQLQKTTRS